MILRASTPIAFLLALSLSAGPASAQLNDIPLDVNLTVVQFDGFTDDIAFGDSAPVQQPVSLGFLPSEVKAVYLEIRGRVDGAELGDGTLFTVRQAGLPATERTLYVDNDGTATVERSLYVWVPIDASNQALEFSVTPVAPAESVGLTIALRGAVY